MRDALAAISEYTTGGRDEFFVQAAQARDYCNDRRDQSRKLHALDQLRQTTAAVDRDLPVLMRCARPPPINAAS